MRSRPPGLLRKSSWSRPLLVSGLREHGRTRLRARRRVLRRGAAGAGSEHEQLGQVSDPSLLAPLMLTHATSPAAYKPASGVAPLMSVWTPPIM